MEITKLAYPDPLQFLKDNKYYDPKSTQENPRWLNVDVTLVKKLPLIELKKLRNYTELKNMMILRKGNRLSITPISQDEWSFINTII
jgi:predicted RNA-binding protein with PUA-like domain